MNVYLLTETSGMVAPTRYHPTLADAHAAAKAHVKIRPTDQPDVRIELIDIGTSKADILAILNCAGGYQRGGPLRTWRLGDRGGLIECNNGE